VFRRSSKWKNVVGDHKQVKQILQHMGIMAGQMDEGVIVVDLKGAIHFANTAWAKMHGRKSSTELLGKEITQFHTKEQMRKNVVPFIEEAKRRGQFKGTVEHLRKDGTTFQTQTKMAVLKDDEGKTCGLVVIVKDATAPKQSEERARETTEQEKELKKQIQQLRQQATECKPAEKQLKQDRDRLRQQVEELTAELTAVSEKLQKEAAKCKRAKTELKQYRDQLEVHVKQGTAELKAANEQLQQEISELRLSDEDPEESDTEEEVSNKEINLLDSDKLKALSELAKRLA
jgi:PAS domain S-box-containing protein